MLNNLTAIIVDRYILDLEYLLFFCFILLWLLLFFLTMSLTVSKSTTVSSPATINKTPTNSLSQGKKIVFHFWPDECGYNQRATFTKNATKVVFFY